MFWAFIQRGYSQNQSPETFRRKVLQSRAEGLRSRGGALPSRELPGNSCEQQTAGLQIFVYFCYRKFFDYSIEHLQKQRYNR